MRYHRGEKGNKISKEKLKGELENIGKKEYRVMRLWNLKTEKMFIFL